MNIENNVSRKINIFSIAGFVISLLPTLGLFGVLLYQNKARPTALDSFLEVFFFRPSFLYAGAGIVLSIVSLVVIKKTSEKGKILAYTAIALGVLTILVSYRFTAFQENERRLYESEQQRQIQEKLQHNGQSEKF